jgi:hypothetical protein
VANFVVSEARRNHHAPSDQQEEEELLIYNWAPTYTGKVRRGMVACGRLDSPDAVACH